MSSNSGDGRNSCVYTGTIRHRRLEPVGNAFRYSLFMLYLDLDELPHLFNKRWFWSARRPALAWFRRADYLGSPEQPLGDAVRDLVEQRTGRRPAGPIRLLTHLRFFGYVMNPVSFYYCFDPAGSAVETIVAEITNTPWGERHSYVLSALARGADAEPASGRAVQRYRFAKEFHVSPFMAMEQRYDWRFSPPGDRLLVHMENFERRGKLFDATLLLRREPLNGRSLATALAMHPWMTAKVAAGIYWQALRLFLKRTPFHPHPATRKSDVSPSAIR
jgi:uncharacterized protein